MACFHFRSWRQGLSLLLSLGTVSGAVGVMSPPAKALSWMDLLLQGGQYFQLSNVSKQQEVELGKQINQELHSKYKFVTNSRENAYVNRVGQRVAAVSDCSQYPFHFSIVDDPSINAFSTTGGYVYVNSGLLKAIDNESELAGVLGHEIGHICDNDLIHKMRQAALEQGLASVAGLNQNTIVNLGTQLAVNLPNSRQDEFNADAQGQKYLERAGYNPYGLVDFLKKLLNEPSPPAFLSDHPGTKQRIALLEKKITANR